MPRGEASPGHRQGLRPSLLRLRQGALQATPTPPPEGRTVMPGPCHPRPATTAITLRFLPSWDCALRWLHTAGPGHAEEDSQSQAFTVETVDSIY